MAIGRLVNGEGCKTFLENEGGSFAVEGLIVVL